jgi:hypothetical protein
MTSGPHRLVVRTSRRGRDNPGSTPDVLMFGPFPCPYNVRALGHKPCVGMAFWQRPDPCGPGGRVAWARSCAGPRLCLVRCASRPFWAETPWCQMRYMPNRRQYAPLFASKYAARSHAPRGPIPCGAHNRACVPASGIGFPSSAGRCCLRRRCRASWSLCRPQAKPSNCPHFEKGMQAVCSWRARTAGAAVAGA